MENVLNSKSILKHHIAGRLKQFLMVAAFLWPLWILWDYFYFNEAFYYVISFRVLLSLSCLTCFFLLYYRHINLLLAEFILLIPSFLFIGWLVNSVPSSSLTFAFISSSIIPVSTFIFLVLPLNRILLYTIFSLSVMFVFNLIVNKHSLILMFGQGGVFYFSLTIAMAVYAYYNYKRFINEVEQQAIIQTKQLELQNQHRILEQKNQALNESLIERELLLKEVHHRVKNNLQIISSLLRLQENSLKNKSTLDVLKESENRIAAMSLIHENLYKSENIARVDINKYLQDLTSYIQATHNPTKKIVTRLDIDAIPLSIEQLVPCGLIINEIFTNSIKYAFENTENPEIRITGRKKGQLFTLAIQDNGKGLNDDFSLTKGDTLGIKLIYGLTKQIKGNIHTFNNQGAVFEISFPMEEIA